jgi:hypothetical protein
MSTHAFVPSFQPFNFFAPEPEVEELATDESGEVAYALVQSGPAVPADEVECDIDTVEIKAKWGAQVLSVSHVEPTKSYFVGDGTDVVLPEESLGASRAAILERGYVIVPAGAVATIGDQSFAGPTEIALTPKTVVSLAIGAVTFEITTVRKGKVTKAGFLARLAGGATGFVGLSLLGHAAIVASMAMFMPKLATDDAEAVDRDQMMLMQKFLTAAAEREQDPPKPLPGTTEEATGGGSTGGEAHKGESGAAGTPTAQPKVAHMAFAGQDDTSTVTKNEIAEFGLLGLLRGGIDRDPNAKTSPWGEDTYKGMDNKSFMGALMGANADDVFGYGLNMTGTGEGGGGLGSGVGIDGIGSTVGGGGGGTGKWGYGKGDKDGMGNGHGNGLGGHVVKTPIIRTPTFDTNGRLPAEVIQRIVRQNAGRFRLCYENGLTKNPGLTGRVVTKFIIGRDGSVASATDAGSDMPDQVVTQCVVRSFTNLSFPPPQGGIATVSYPFIFSPGT